ncbi:hypothetical protein ACIRBY_14740 [Streptomyces sp. NPDC096136]|uniref:hypothetical protein n=1 Tax=Streptomyces sp. NPDC096136 TaxID=3366076 RepID=UPI0037FFCEA9
MTAGRREYGDGTRRRRGPLYRWTVVHAHLTRDTLARAAAETGIDDQEAARALDSLLAAGSQSVR